MFTFSSDLKNMQLVIMVRKSRATQQEIRWTRLKLERVGRLRTLTHRWSLVSFFLTLVENRCLKAERSDSPATGKIRSTIPSSSSTASHLSHRKKNLKLYSHY